MKICFLHMTMGIVSRGSEISTDLIATQLAKKNEVLVIQSGKISKKPYQVKRIFPQESAMAVAPRNLFEKIMFRLHLDEDSGRIAGFTREAIDAIRQFSPDIIIPVNGSIQIKVLRSSGLKSRIVVFGRAGIGYHDRDTLKQIPDLFIALSEKAEIWARDHASPKTKVIFIPNPIVVNKVKPIDLQLQKPVVMVVAALSKYKNVDKVIEAVRMTAASLLLVGDGEESGVISSALAELPNEFRWIKQLDPEMLPGYYSAADMFCFVPDPQEAFGRVYLEAMAAGLPIIASDDPIRRSIIGDQGNYVNPSDIQGIANLITKNSHSKRISYLNELNRYELKSVVIKIEKELNDLLK